MSLDTSAIRPPSMHPVHAAVSSEVLGGPTSECCITYTEA